MRMNQNRKTHKRVTHSVHAAILGWKLQSWHEGILTWAASATYPFRNLWKTGRECGCRALKQKVNRRMRVNRIEEQTSDVMVGRTRELSE